MLKAFATIGFVLASGAAMASSYQVCNQPFALCAASSSSPTGKTIVVNGISYPEMVAVCPVMHGPAVGDTAGGNMKGSCANPGTGQVWSLYQPRKNIPQAPNWDPKTPAPYRTFTTAAGAGLSNMFSFSCTLTKKVKNVQLANCYGPADETLAGTPVPVGTKVITQAPVGASYPVGGPLP